VPRVTSQPVAQFTAKVAQGSNLFASIQVGSIELRQRTWIPAMVPWRATEDGFDVQMQTNHLSHFLLTKLCFDLLEKAAKAHAQYVEAGGETGHYEKNTTNPYYTGNSIGDRQKHEGYNSAYPSEVGSYTSANALESIKVDLGAPYHRNALLRPVCTAIGMGQVNDTFYGNNAGGKDASGKYVHANTTADVIVYPYPGQKDTAIGFYGFETPNPLAGSGLTDSGTPISIIFKPDEHRRTDNIRNVSVKLYQEGGENIPIALSLNQNNCPDPVMAQGEYLFFPAAELDTNTTYTVKLTYTDNGRAKSKTWSFTTRAGEAGDGGDDGASVTSGKTELHITRQHQIFEVESGKAYYFTLKDGEPGDLEKNSYRDVNTSNRIQTNIVLESAGNGPTYLTIKPVGNSGARGIFSFDDVKVGDDDILKIGIEIK